MKKLVFYLFVFLLAGFGCKMNNETMKPKVSGPAGEVLVVVPAAIWSGAAGDTLENLLTREVPYLPQPEPMFNVIHIIPANFSKMFQPYRNIIFVRIGSQYKTAKMVVERDKWAAPQYIVDMEAPDVSSFIRLVKEGGTSLIDRINQMERNRIIEYYRHYLDEDIYKALKKKYYLTLDVPKGYNLSVDSTDFAWISSETPTVSQDILIYTFSYTSEKIFTKDSLIAIRNRVLKKYVHGEIKGTYMSTEMIIPPEFRTFERNGNFFTELRGLWKLQNGYMGGPFISFSTVDKSRDRVITIEGYVYAPGEKKRELLRQVESILYTLKVYPETK